mgnify:CR=1 FL=1
MLMCKCNDFPVIKKDRKGIFPSKSSIPFLRGHELVYSLDGMRGGGTILKYSRNPL